MKPDYDRFSRTLATIAGRPGMLGLAIALCGIGCAAFLHGDDHMLAGASLAISAVTLLLLPILQATQNRDSSALHAKLDELIKIHSDAKDTLIGLERRSAHEIEKVRAASPRG